MFEMGTGVSSPLLSPDLRILALFSWKTAAGSMPGLQQLRCVAIYDVFLLLQTVQSLPFIPSKLNKKLLPSKPLVKRSTD